MKLIDISGYIEAKRTLVKSSIEFLIFFYAIFISSLLLLLMKDISMNETLFLSFLGFIILILTLKISRRPHKPLVVLWDTTLIILLIFLWYSGQNYRPDDISAYVVLLIVFPLYPILKIHRGAFFSTSLLDEITRPSIYRSYFSIKQKSGKQLFTFLLNALVSMLWYSLSLVCLLFFRLPGSLWLAKKASRFGGSFIKDAKREMKNNLAEERKKDSRPPILLLRSFVDEELEIRLNSTFDQIKYAIGIEPTFQEKLAYELSQYGPVICVQNPHKEEQPLDIICERYEEGIWSERVSTLMNEAKKVVVILGKTEGIKEEYKMLRLSENRNKIILIIPPLEASELAERAAVFNDILSLDANSSLMFTTKNLLMASFDKNRVDVAVTGPDSYADSYCFGINKLLDAPISAEPVIFHTYYKRVTKKLVETFGFCSIRIQK